jgi:hypothetical protein
MPYAVQRHPHRNCSQVVNIRNGRIKSVCTSRRNADKQVKLLRAIMYNPNFNAFGRQPAAVIRRRRRPGGTQRPITRSLTQRVLRNRVVRR